MTANKSTYYTTALAGYHVAGRRIPSAIVDGAERPLVGHALDLTPVEAAYELGAGTISRAPPDVAPAGAAIPASAHASAPTISFAPPPAEG